jgi:hypothetical protein
LPGVEYKRRVGELFAPSASTPSDRLTDVRGTERWAEAAVRDLRSTATRIADFIVQAAELDERAAALARERGDLDAGRRQLDEAIAVHGDAVADLGLREERFGTAVVALRSQFELVGRQQAQLEEARSNLAELARNLAEQEREFERRASRLHWRLLLRAWQWRPRFPSGGARVCELLFVPSSDGYKLLQQDGVALEQDATVRGLLGEQMTYVVTKIAPWPFDGRWCAYLQQT